MDARNIPFGQMADIRHVAFVSGLMAAGLAANSEILQIRWAPSLATRRLAILDISFGAVVDTVAFAAGNALFTGIKATAWTVDGTGGAALDLSNGRGKVDPDAFTYDVPGIRVATTAALGAGTKTNGINTTHMPCAPTTTAGALIQEHQSLVTKLALEQFPYILRNQEGLLLTATVPATGTWRFGGNIAFAVLP